MALVNKSVLVAYTAQQMFDLVERVEDYAVFLPWCSGSEVKGREGDQMVATLHIDYFNIKQQFTTENTSQAPTLIKMRLLDGPFRQLNG